MKKKIIIVIFSFVLFFIIAEGTLAIAIKIKSELDNWQEKSGLFVGDTILGWRGGPHMKLRVRSFEREFLVVTDQEGFRNIKDERDNSKTGIFLFGDSFVWGVGVDNDKTIASFVEKKTGASVMNYGMIGYGTDQQYLLMKEKVDSTDLVIVIFYINDLSDMISDNMNTEYPGKPKFVIMGDSLVLTNCPVGHKNMVKSTTTKKREFYNFKHMVSETIKKVLYMSNIYKLIVSYLQYTSFGKWMYEKNLMEIPVFMSFEWRLGNEEILKEALPVFDLLTLKMKEEAESMGAKLLFILIPHEFQYQEKSRKWMNALRRIYGYESGIEEAMDSVVGILENNKVHYIYPLELFEKEHRKKSLTYTYDKHLNEWGNEIVADLISVEFFCDSVLMIGK
jgi:hypothetical protein